MMRTRSSFYVSDIAAEAGDGQGARAEARGVLVRARTERRALGSQPLVAGDEPRPLGTVAEPR